MVKSVKAYTATPQQIAAHYRALSRATIAEFDRKRRANRSAAKSLKNFCDLPPAQLPR